MAERRMFAKTIIDSDAFLEMPTSTQLLYFHLSMRADDEGFVNKAKTIMRMTGAKDDDMNVLIHKKFVIPFESGVVVIKHWKIHNYIKNDRITSTKYTEEKATLSLDENKAYRIKSDENIIPVSSLYPVCIQNDSKVDTQVRLGKVRLGKGSNTSVGKNFVQPTVSDVSAYCIERKNKVDAETFVDFYTSKDWYVGKSKMKDWKACIRTWEKGNNNTSGKRNDREDVLPVYEESVTVSNEEKEKLKERIKALKGE